MARHDRQDIGRVGSSQRTIIAIEVEASIDTPAGGFDHAVEFHLIVNGKTVKRMDAWQAERMGLIAPEGMR